jgi:hypothetical protein
MDENGVDPKTLAARLGVTPKSLRGWLRAGSAAGHPILAGHVHGQRWIFSGTESDQLATEFRQSHS